MITKPLKLTDARRRELARKLASALGDGRVNISEGVRQSYTGVAHAPKTAPDFVVLPDSVEDVQKVLRFANRHLIPVTPVCSGSQEPSTNPMFGGIVIDCMSMNKILEVNADAAYVLVEPGVTIGQLAKETRRHGFRVTVGSFPPGLSALGNYIVTNVNTHRATYRDDVVALEVVLPDGTVARTGSKAFGDSCDIGWHSVCNAYPDLKYLFLDAGGTLGVVTKAAVRMYALNESRPLVAAAFDAYPQSLEMMKRLTRANLVQHVCVWHWVLYTIIDHLQLYGHGGSSDVMIHDPWNTPDDRPYNLVVPTMSGYREDMEGHLKSIRRLIAELGGADYAEELKTRFPGAHAFFTEHYCEHVPTTTFMGGYGEAKPLFPIVIVDPAKVADLEHWALRRLRSSILKLGLAYYSHSTDQNRAVFIRFTPFMPFDSSPEEMEEAKKVYSEIMDTALRKYGAVPCRNTMRNDFFDKSEATLNLMGGYAKLLRSIKKALDPNNVLNPGFTAAYYGGLSNK
ncbi:MAG: FAD-binding oxidoreductase [bacterium]